MIIEIIIGVGLLGSLIGLFLFGIHFFKHKKHVDKNKTEKIIERVVNGKTYKVPNDLLNQESFTDKIIEFFLRHSSKIAFFCFVLVFINIVFQPFSQNTQTVTPTPAPVPNTDGPASVNGSVNGTGDTFTDTFNEVFGSSFANGKVPWWFYALIFGIPMWIFWKIIRGSRYDF